MTTLEGREGLQYNSVCNLHVPVTTYEARSLRSEEGVLRAEKSTYYHAKATIEQAVYVTTYIMHEARSLRSEEVYCACNNHI